MTQPRVAPLAPDQLDGEQQAYLKPFTDSRGRYPNIFGVLCRHMPLLNAWTGFGLYTMRGSRVDPRLREVLILRTACNARSDYEWHQHRRIALRLGMTEAEVDAVRGGAPTGDNTHDLMISCADELAHDSRLSDMTWEKLVSAYGLEWTLDAVLTVGAYTALAMALNSADVQIEDSRP